MESSNKENILKLLTKRFLDNRRMQLFFDSNSLNYERKIYNLLSFCLKKVVRVEGTYSNETCSFAALYYEKEKLRFRYKDFIDIILLIYQIGLKSALNINRIQKAASKLRLGFDNYLYVLFMAQDAKQQGIHELLKFNRFIENLAAEKKLPILIETTDGNLLNLYQRAGFVLYNHCEKSGIFYLIKKVAFSVSHKNAYQKAA